jgi:hypothetical protein
LTRETDAAGGGMSETIQDKKRTSLAGLGIFFASAAIGFGAGALYRDLFIMCIVAVLSVVGLSLAYYLLARALGWRRLRWSDFFVNLFYLLS